MNDYFDLVKEYIYKFAPLGIKKFKSGAALIGKAPHVAELAYSHKLLPPLSEEKILFLEEELICKFGRKDLGLGPLLNLTNGGDGATNPSVETRQKIGAANKGRKRSAETVAMMSESRKGIPSGRLGVPNPMKKTEPHENTGKVRSQEFKDNLSVMHKGKVAWNKGIPATKEHKIKNSIANIGRKDSAEVRAKKSAATKGKVKSETHRLAISQTLLNKPKYECLHCNRLLTEYNYNRFHNDNCKYKEKENGESN